MLFLCHHPCHIFYVKFKFKFIIFIDCTRRSLLHETKFVIFRTLLITVLLQRNVCDKLINDQSKDQGGGTCGSCWRAHWLLIAGYTLLWWIRCWWWCRSSRWVSLLRGAGIWCRSWRRVALLRGRRITRLRLRVTRCCSIACWLTEMKKI